MTGDLQRAAVAYATELGWRVHPLHPPGASCATPGKQPRLKDWPRRASTDPSTIEHWWQQHPDSNIGVATGGGLVVIDIDPERGGDESIARLHTQSQALPPTVEAITGGGGRHLYFTSDAALRSSADRLGPGLDLRAAGGQVVAPPSVHPTGELYDWARSPFDSPPSQLPTWLLMIAGRRKPAGAAPDVVGVGGRNAHLVRVAGQLRARVDLTPEALTAALHAENDARCRPPLPAREVDGIVASALAWPAVPTWVADPARHLTHPLLSSADARVLDAYIRHAGPDGSCWPSRKRIAAMARVDERTVRKAARRLEELRLIRCDPRDGETNLITVLPVEGGPTTATSSSSGDESAPGARMGRGGQMGLPPGDADQGPA